MTGRPKQQKALPSRARIGCETSLTPFADALKRVLAERYGTTWQEAYRLLKAGIKPIRF